ncbi:Flp pilus assembly protein TadD [Variovorax boronicumulans]|uniref:Flp pilus assembly protein TadD n=1 Tax=Variovorax boronicumulans TaxID=436515 RepID=A0AAW8E659_9BURK|nr:tetratricopeptide repeat protein [Variovorax boronicumulans]MDP9882421.1 Flp pilus assembly protein TadD [Variovorax boronicumulans]MDP9927731.1 Flp pilus assembly protein TadD [Variovorax boronicumulans]
MRALFNSGTRITLSSVVVMLALAASGCAATKDRYAAGEDAQQRQAFEAANEMKTGANIDTQSTYLKVVDQMQQQGLWFASLAHIDALEQRWGITPDSTRARADALRQTDQAELAETAYKRLLTTPQESAGYRGLGLLAGARGNYVEAVQLFKQAQRRTPTDALLLSDLGYASLRAGQLEEARLPLMQALQLQPDNKQAQANVALYLEVTNQQEQATALMNANRMSDTTRTAVREAALQMRAAGSSTKPPASMNTTGSASASASTRVSTRPHDDAATVPLALKPTRWAGMGGIRTATQMNPSAATTELPLSTNPNSRGTP